MEDVERFNELRNRLNQNLNESLKAFEKQLDETRIQREKELLNAMEKALNEGNLSEAYRCQLMLEIWG